MKKVIIVESPAKAKTISSYLKDNFLLLSSCGHIRDLAKSGKEHLGVDILNNFQPHYKIISHKKKILQNLVKFSCNKKVFLATDFDREGEAIAWHLSCVLKLNKKNKNRIVFSELTKEVIIHALKNPRIIDESLVFSQETRRILDRIIGFKLSRLVQKRLQLDSAGRVQSVALHLIVSLEKQIQDFVVEEYYLIKAIFSNFQVKLIHDHTSSKINLQQSKQIIADLDKKPFIVQKIIKKTILRQPPTAFTTSTLQQEAFKKINMNTVKTMLIAQKLYEGSIKIANNFIGLITYMRTDSTRLSLFFIQQTQQFILSKYGKQYLGNYYQKNNLFAQDAHEAIRPTDITKTPDSLKKYLNHDEYLLYELIYNRALSSLMASAIFKQTQVIFQASKYYFLLEGLMQKFEGYQQVVGNYTKDQILLPFKLGEVYYPVELLNQKCFTKPTKRFTEATLIKKLEKLNIGRPSTYVYIISILKKRLYVITKDKMFFPTENGILINEVLQNFFSNIINIQYSAHIEKKLDDIALGKDCYKKVLKEFYEEFKQYYDIAYKQIANVMPSETQQKCSLCNAGLVVKKSRYGKFLGCSNFPKCKNTVNMVNKI